MSKELNKDIDKLSDLEKEKQEKEKLEKEKED